MQGNRIIVHALIKYDEGYLLTKRSKNESTFKEYWDIPGGLAEYKELPKQALIRETQEEVGIEIIPLNIIHEDSNYDKNKDMVFIRLVYLCELKNKTNIIKLQLEEHSEYKIIKSLDELKSEKIVPFLYEVFQNIKTK